MVVMENNYVFFPVESSSNLIVPIKSPTFASDDLRNFDLMDKVLEMVTIDAEINRNNQQFSSSTNTNADQPASLSNINIYI
jgi:hypothetical protein